MSHHFVASELPVTIGPPYTRTLALGTCNSSGECGIDGFNPVELDSTIPYCALLSCHRGVLRAIASLFHEEIDLGPFLGKRRRRGHAMFPDLGLHRGCVLRKTEENLFVDYCGAQTCFGMIRLWKCLP